MVEPDRPQMTIWHMRIACCIPKTTYNHSEYVYVKLIACPLQSWLHESAFMLHNKYIVYLVHKCSYTFLLGRSRLSGSTLPTLPPCLLANLSILTSQVWNTLRRNFGRWMYMYHVL